VYNIADVIVAVLGEDNWRATEEFLVFVKRYCKQKQTKIGRAITAVLTEIV